MARIRVSLATVEPQVLTPSTLSYEDRVDRLSASLLEAVIDPIRVQVTSACAKEGAFKLFGASEVWAIARREGSWLLTLKNEPEFALAFGDDPMELKLHGFASDDALGEWCV